MLSLKSRPSSPKKLAVSEKSKFLAFLSEGFPYYILLYLHFVCYIWCAGLGFAKRFITINYTKDISCFLYTSYIKHKYPHIRPYGSIQVLTNFQKNIFDFQKNEYSGIVLPYDYILPRMLSSQCDLRTRSIKSCSTF